MTENTPAECQWCYQPGMYATWTPRHGWHDLCERHHTQTQRDLVAHLIERMAETGRPTRSRA
jgi:hypothetical protein